MGDIHIASIYTILTNVVIKTSGPLIVHDGHQVHARETTALGYFGCQILPLNNESSYMRAASGKNNDAVTLVTDFAGS